MNFQPLRLRPGSDVRRAVEQMADDASSVPLFVLSGIGSLSEARLRFAGAQVECALAGPLEILTLSGSVTTDGAHLHITVADEKGRVYGGHLCYGNLVETTLELLLAPLPGWECHREDDEETGYAELTVQPRT